MNRSEIVGTVQEIFRDILGRKDLVLTDTLTASEVSEWDSFTHISIITTVEKHYKIRFALGEIDSLQNVGDMISAIERKITQ